MTVGCRYYLLPKLISSCTPTYEDLPLTLAVFVASETLRTGEVRSLTGREEGADFQPSVERVDLALQGSEAVEVALSQTLRPAELVHQVVVYPAGVLALALRPHSQGDFHQHKQYCYTF